MTPARRIWEQIEAVHAVTYFAGESTDAAKETGLKGFWMGYFGFRAAPLGAVGAGAVEASFANFAPTMVQRAIPDAWTYATPTELIAARRTSAATALRRLSTEAEEVADEVNGPLEAAIACASSIARPLFAANAALDPTSDQVERLWQNCTTLREHRGDGHVATLASHMIDGCEAHLLIAAEHGWDSKVFFDNRGWTVDQQTNASNRLQRRGLLDEFGRLTVDGAELRSEVEKVTDTLAVEPYNEAMSQSDLDALIATLTLLATTVTKSQTIPFPNPMGLPDPAGEARPTST